MLGVIADHLAGHPRGGVTDAIVWEIRLPRVLLAAVVGSALTRCFLALAYDEATPGPRNAQTAVAIARWLHPAAFGLPADGS